MIGAFAAALVAIGFEEFLRRRERKANRKHVVAAVVRLHVALLPFMNDAALRKGEGITNFEHEYAQNAARDARGALQWARNRPELFTFEEWTRLVTVSDIFEVWAAWYARNAGGLEPLYAGQMDTMSVARLAHNLRPHLDAAIV